MTRVTGCALLLLILIPLSVSSGPLYQCVGRDGTLYLTDRWDRDYVKCTPLDVYRETPGGSAPAAETRSDPAPPGQAQAPATPPGAEQGVTSEAETNVQAGEAAPAPQAQPEPPKKKPAYWPPVRGR